ASLGTVIAYTNTKGERWEYPLGRMMQHLANHSSYHRGQVTTMLRQLGAAVSPVDLLVFMDVQNKK
ncbi:MAG: DinB family protein, partial [Blastocatellia bacterium]